MSPLFASERWPRRPYCSSNLREGVVIRSLSEARRAAYIQPNPPHLRAWAVFDVDRPGAAFAWEDANLPLPTWTSINPQNGHAHLCYGLKIPVLIAAENKRMAPLRYLNAIERSFRVSLKADWQYSGLITKNPMHSHWKTIYHDAYYDLGDLAEYVDLESPLATGKLEEVGLGRNVALFDLLRQWAYVAVRRHRKNRNITLWLAEVFDKAIEHNMDFAQPLSAGEVQHIAKSIAKWVWKMDPRVHEDWLEKQRSRGALGGTAKGQAYEERRKSARLMRQAGKTHQQIAQELQVSKRSVISWCK